MKLLPAIVVALALAVPALARAQVSDGTVVDSLPGTRLRWELVAVPAGTVVVPGTSGADTVAVEGFLIGRTEVPWELYDVFYLRLDVPRAARAGIDARSRPSRPYGAPDRGFGHRGYPAISLTHAAAVAFAEWLSARTGHRYAVPSDAQWQRAADLAAEGAAPPPAWSRRNALGTTHPVAKLEPDAHGLYDLFGNAGEWVTGSDGTPWLRGGSFADAADSVGPRHRARQEPAWNQTDPQIPKSRWWLSDGPFAGLRLVRIP